MGGCCVFTWAWEKDGKASKGRYNQIEIGGANENVPAVTSGGGVRDGAVCSRCASHVQLE